MNVNYILKGKNNPTNIVCRFKPNQQIDFSCSTGIWINKEDWNIDKQRLKPKITSQNRDLINSKLKEMKGSIIDNWINDSLKKVPVSNDWLKDIIYHFFGIAKIDETDKIYFTDWVIKFIKESPKRLHKGEPIAERTIKHYETTFNKIKAFEKINKTKLRHEHVDLKFYRNFIDYCRTVENLGNNTIGGYITNFKMWCKNIELEGLPINSQYKHSEFMALSNKTKDTYLNENEINAIFKHDFTENPRLDNTRDLFIIGLRTGLRISDFLRLKDINFIKGFIEIETAKTGERVVIPLHHQIHSILEKRNGALPNTISDQKFNLYIKEICQKVEINEMTEGAKVNPETKRKETGTFPKFELISSHTCRRSFASNLYGKLPNMTIMAITGHQNESVFLKYIKITKNEHAEALRRFWAKEQENENFENILLVAK